MRAFPLFCVLAAVLSAPLAAQVTLPSIPLPRVDGLADRVVTPVTDAAAAATRLARERLRTIDRLVRRERTAIERDARGDPARRGELLVMDIDPTGLETAQRAGFAIIENNRIGELDLVVTRLRIPPGLRLADAEALLGRLVPQAAIAADALHFQTGSSQTLPSAAPVSAARSAASVPIGVIDGAPGPAVPTQAVRGFASGAPAANDHGSAVVSLLASAGAGSVRVADVFGTEAAGGNALAIARALGWLVGTGSRVVTISLVGPRNAILERAVGAALRRGVVIVAAVGNDGPAAPPAYPASYPGVLAVTAVDGKRRALIEAGRALHLDYAAPGADIRGIDARGKRIALRGTSFAAPLVAARAAQAMTRPGWRDTLRREAVDLGKAGPDDVYGIGLLCAHCRGR